MRFSRCPCCFWKRAARSRLREIPDEDGAEEMSPDRTEMLKAESTLYIGDGYSIYIFDEGWVYQSDTMGGYHTDI